MLIKIFLSIHIILKKTKLFSVKNINTITTFIRENYGVVISTLKRYLPNKHSKWILCSQFTKLSLKSRWQLLKIKKKKKWYCSVVFEDKLYSFIRSFEQISQIDPISAMIILKLILLAGKNQRKKKYLEIPTRYV